ncbi:unnamed protein product, partial [marine sediment metagenome]
ATGTEFEIGMQACVGGIVVGPYQQIPTRWDDSCTARIAVNPPPKPKMP